MAQRTPSKRNTAGTAPRPEGCLPAGRGFRPLEYALCAALTALTLLL